MGVVAEQDEVAVEEGNKPGAASLIVAWLVLSMS
jgi:hypothetical protein